MKFLDKLITKLISKVDLSDTGNSKVDALQDKMVDIYSNYAESNTTSTDSTDSTDSSDNLEKE